MIAWLVGFAAYGAAPRRALTDDATQQADPQWSPYATKILFGGLATGPKSAIRVLDVFTHQVSVVPGSEGLFVPLVVTHGSVYRRKLKRLQEISVVRRENSRLDIW